MKYLVILMIVFQTNISFAKNKKKKVLSKGTQSFKSFECKQKTLPIDMKYSVTENEVDLEIQFQDDLSDFQLVNVRGIDGVTVSNFQTESPRNKLKFSKESYHIEYSKADGLGYVVLEANANRNGKIQKQNGPVLGPRQPIPVGRRESPLCQCRLQGCKRCGRFSCGAQKC